MRATISAKLRWGAANRGHALIYLDNAATSYPKPPEVVEAVCRYMTDIGGNPARSGHSLALKASRAVYDARENLARMVNCDDPLRVVFTANATTALNLALNGLLIPGNHVVTTSIEHNSVMRPLRALERRGIEVTVVQCDEQGFADPDDVRNALRPHTAMVAMIHASNVLGSIEPIHEIGQICREADILFLVDAAQSLGVVPVDLESDCIDLLAFSGHKALYGPQGTGGLVVGDRVNPARIRPIICGGTGSSSESEEQPGFLPDLWESGTLNGPGIAGLNAGVEFVLSKGIDGIREHEIALTARLLDGLLDIPGVTVYGPHSVDHRVAVLSFNLAGRDPAQVALSLDERHGIACRAGLHCSPSAHKTTGTFPTGSIRFGLSWFTTEADIDATLSAVRELAAES